MKRELAITGPSGAGKTCLSNYLRDKYKYPYPVHTTTREKRPDDENGFYRYVSVEEFLEKVENKEFLFYSGYKGRYYGILKSDFEETFNKNLGLVINVNYMDLEQLSLIKEKYNMTIIQLTFKDIPKMIIERTCERGQKPEDTQFRIEVATCNEVAYQEQIKKYVDITCYTDEYSFEEEIKFIEEELEKRNDN
jgi:guanylate kinase